MLKTNVTLGDIINNLQEAIVRDGIGASRITMNNTDLLSLLIAIKNELDGKQHVADSSS